MDLLRARHAQLMISFLATEKLLTDISAVRIFFKIFLFWIIFKFNLILGTRRF